MGGGVLDRETIREHLRGPEPLLKEYLDLEVQLQPNGFDLTLREVLRFASAGKTGMDSSTLSQNTAAPFGEEGELHLPKGAYIVTFNEIVNLPRNIMALARPRSSLLRCGVALHTAVWDAGYWGRSQALLTVYNPFGHSLAKNARLLQMVFMHLEKSVQEGYRGRFLGENI